VRQAIHFFNVPCAADANAPDNPLNIIRSVYRPGDFVVGLDGNAACIFTLLRCFQGGAQHTPTKSVFYLLLSQLSADCTVLHAVPPFSPCSTCTFFVSVTFVAAQVLKLDIDHKTLELELMGQILEDPKLMASISEMMFEQHYNHPEMVKHFSTPSTKYNEVLKLFSGARKAGLRLHYWP
jgi:hypothetical protein